MEHKIWFDDGQQVVHQQIIGEFTTEETRYFGKKYIELLDGKPYRQLIVDLRDAGKMESRETRSVTNEMLNQAGFTEVVFVGANAATRMIAKVLMKLGSLKAESDFFGNLEDAIKWIEKRRK
ncbi:MAG: STAS/SEC14 domain-containing protein [Bacteroidales bacterium]|nr:STAS/SEC14 domain-containing protein [Bacteroidales bacterium]MCF8457933.1 STAS/SEC14 domain-containing protein [Bacteroidales bacterium]